MKHPRFKEAFMAKTLEERSRSTYGGPKRPKPISENERRIDQINGPFPRSVFLLSSQNNSLLGQGIAQKIPSEDFPAIETEDPPTLKTEWPFPLPSWPAAFFFSEYEMGYSVLRHAT